MNGRDGNDTLFGEAVDVGAGGDAADALSGGDGDDVLVGHDGDDSLDGGNGDDDLGGGNGDDDLIGGEGDDVLGRTVNQFFTDSSDQEQRVTTVENGADLLDGGGGDDTLERERRRDGAKLRFRGHRRLRDERAERPGRVRGVARAATRSPT